MDLVALLNFLFSEYGMLGLFIASIIGNASILLPLPIDFVVLGYGAVAPSARHVFVAGLVSGIGAGIGEMSAYLLGYLGTKGVERIKKQRVVSIAEIRERLQYKGMWVIFLGALTPFPFDVVGIAAGLIKYDPKKFFVAALLGKVVRYITLAYAAYYGWNALIGFLVLA